MLERRGIVERDIENAWLAGDGEPGPLDDLIGHSITYRIAVGPRAGQKLFTLQTLPAREEADDQQADHRGAALAGGFSLHAAIANLDKPDLGLGEGYHIEEVPISR